LATVDDDVHLRNMIQAVLFTSPGERVNRPSFGSGIRQLVFSPLSPAIAAATQATVQASLQAWLGDQLVIEGVTTRIDESTLWIRVSYSRLGTGARAASEFPHDTPRP
jgi:phage baseplate assembly protein W